MKLEDVFKMLKSTGLEVAYNSFPKDKVPQMPFIVWRCAEQDNFFADDKVFLETQKVIIELLTPRKDLNAEQKIKKVLKDIPWKSYEFQDEKEEFFRKTYEMEIDINE